VARLAPRQRRGNEALLAATAAVPAPLRRRCGLLLKGAQHVQQPRACLLLAGAAPCVGMSALHVHACIAASSVVIGAPRSGRMQGPRAHSEGGTPASRTCPWPAGGLLPPPPQPAVLGPAAGGGPSASASSMRGEARARNAANLGSSTPAAPPLAPAGGAWNWQAASAAPCAWQAASRGCSGSVAAATLTPGTAPGVP
jgi:hypothetical protein